MEFFNEFSDRFCFLEINCHQPFLNNKLCCLIKMHVNHFQFLPNLFKGFQLTYHLYFNIPTMKYKVKPCSIILQSPLFENNLVSCSKIRIGSFYNTKVIIPMKEHFHFGTPHQVVNTPKPFNWISYSFQIACVWCWQFQLNYQLKIHNTWALAQVFKYISNHQGFMNEFNIAPF